MSKRAVLLICILASSFAVSIEAQAASSAHPYRDGTVLVGFRTGVDRASQLEIERAAGASEVRVVGVGTHVLRVAGGRVEQTISALKRSPKVSYAEPDYVVRVDATPNDPSYSQLWAMQNTGQTGGTNDADIDADLAWDVTTGSSSIVVGVVDTGVNYNHPDLAANIWSNPGINGCAAGTHGYRSEGAITSCDPNDDHFHGSHVSGTIGAVGNNNTGVVGVNWSVKIMGLKFLNSSGSGSTVDAINVIHWAVLAKQAGVNLRVLSNSWGGGGFSQSLLDEINFAGQNDILFVAAAGNSSSNNDTSPMYPCAYNASNIVCVAASDANDNRASFSSYGQTTVDLAAPGVSILSTVLGTGYGTYSGTSMATPHVSGTAALVLSHANQTVSALKSTLLNSVDVLPQWAGLVASGGRLNACRAVGGTCGGGGGGGATAPGTPTLTASAARGKGVQLTWTTPSNGGSTITGYWIYRSTSSGTEALYNSVGVVNSYKDTGTARGARYYYEVRAVNAVGPGPYSNEASAIAK
jgi:serine protease